MKLTMKLIPALPARPLHSSAVAPKKRRSAIRSFCLPYTGIAVLAAALQAGCGGDIGTIDLSTPAARTHIEPFDTGTAHPPVPVDPATMRKVPAADIAPIVLPLWDGRDIDGNPFDIEEPVNIGVGRAVTGFSSLATHLRFRATAQGTQVAAVGVTSPQALGVRLGLQIAQLPANSVLRFYTPNGRETVEISASEIARIRQANLDAGVAAQVANVYWSPEFGTEQTVMEVEIPASATPQEVQLGLSRVSHFLRTMSESMAVPGRLTQSCAIDVQCTPEHLEQGRSVARLSFVDDGGDAGVCSGTLINDSASSGTPYLFTAAHCLENQAWASTLVLDWFFRSASCSATTLDPLTQRQHGGGVLLYMNDPNDVAFVRLNQAPPAGVVYAGSWFGTPPQIGARLTDVHHGAGDVQSFSEVQLKDYCLEGVSGPGGCEPQPVENAKYWFVSSLSGFLAGGSSGSGLFQHVAGKRYLIGALSGSETAYLACDGSGDVPGMETPPGERLDYFSRFDSAYRTALHQWLLQ